MEQAGECSSLNSGTCGGGHRVVVGGLTALESDVALLLGGESLNKGMLNRRPMPKGRLDMLLNIGIKLTVGQAFAYFVQWLVVGIAISLIYAPATVS
jgi:hypothetical protein